MSKDTSVMAALSFAKPMIPIEFLVPYRSMAESVLPGLLCSSNEADMTGSSQTGCKATLMTH